MADRFEVVIVGGGPVGVALAVELGQRGRSVALVERHRTPQRIPKGQNLTQRTLEHFYFWGVVDELRAARVMPPGYPIGGITAYGDLMSEYWYAPPGREIVQDYYFQKNERLPQYLTEEVLRRRLAELPGVETFYGWTAGRVEQDERGARVAVAPTGEEAGAFYSWSADAQQATGQDVAGRAGLRVLEADYVVGCDGARSLVREQLGIDRGGEDFDQRMVLAVFRSRELHEGLKRFPDATTYRVLKPELQGYWQFFGRVDVGEGWFFHAPVPRDTTPENYDVLGLIRQAAGFDFEAQLDHVGFWDLRIAVASRYRAGRGFIAGDACHSHPPYGGFGLNSGLEDAVNLGWKLAARLAGWGGDALLESYGEERRPIFVETGEAMIAGGIEKDRVFLERYSPAKDRAEFAEAWAKLRTTSGAWQAGYEPHYEGSSVVLGPPGAACSIHGEHTFAAQAGHHLAPLRLSSGRNVFEELGPEFTLLALDADEAAVRAMEQAAAARGVPLKVLRDSFADGREAFAAQLVLVRPDQYVVWAGDAAPADPAALWRRVTGAD